MSRKVYLSALTLDQLTNCVDVLCRLSDAGRILQDAGYEPRFALLPGCRPSMSIDVKVPEMWAPVSEADRAAFAAMTAGPAVSPVSEAEAMEPFQPWNVKAASHERAFGAAFGAFEKVELTKDAETAPVAGIDWGGQDFTVTASIEVQADGALIIETGADIPAEVPAAPAQAEGSTFVAIAGQDGGQGAAAILPTVDPVDPAPAPGSASAMADRRPAAWTEDEDARAVEIFVDARRRLVPIGEAYAAVADALGRPLEGTKFRLKNKLAERVEAGLAPPKATPAAKTPAPAPVQPPQPAPAAPLTPTGELQTYLAALPRKLGREEWPLRSDLSLIEMSNQGFAKQDIAVDMGVDAKLIGERFDLLTGQHRDADDKPVRRWKVRDVLAALQALTPAQGE